MWARMVECMLGVWMLISPFVFRHPADARSLWINDLAAGSVLVVLSLASYWGPARWAHWVLFAVGMWLVAWGRLADQPPLPPALQNSLVVGLLVMMFSIVPNDASQPPTGWRDKRRPAS